MTATQNALGGAVGRLPSTTQHRVSNRFYRTVNDGRGELELFVDVLAPAFQGHLVNSQRYGDLYVDEVPGAALTFVQLGGGPALALIRPATVVTNVVVRR